MEYKDIFWGETWRRIRESIVWWIVIWTGVATERALHQKADIDIILSAGSIQALSTFLMALWSISFYDWARKKMPWDFNETHKKLLIWFALASLSWVVNYAGQSHTQWSLEESFLMFWLAWGWLTLYEYEALPKTKEIIVTHRLEILNILTRLWNNLWLV